MCARARGVEAMESAPWPVGLVYHGGRLLPCKLRALLDFVAPRLKVGLSQGAAQD
jgi:hypothetical protein